MSAAEIRTFLERHGLAAHRGRGQNFLHDRELADKLVRLAGVGPEDAVLEIGTGLGILTQALARHARKVVTIEIDSGLIRGLAADGMLPEGVELIHADAVSLDWEPWLDGSAGPWRVVANLPYSAATPILRRLLDEGHRLAGWGVMVQRELAARLSAEVGERDYGSFSVIHQLCARQTGALDLHGRCFYPVPRVVSRFVCMAPRVDRPSAAELDAVEGVARAGFGHRRKTLANSLRRSGRVDAARIELACNEAGIDPSSRAQTVPPASWLALARAFQQGAAG
ncbi:MAG: ribosomal RNA small subunit methyltransferase A [bacterium]|nr:ribosomal RNA small subunit methyltransferase A [bacterium]MCP5066656.1 ribosomal RNA small subunit methyltransferase A [bacterium]